MEAVKRMLPGRFERIICLSGGTNKNKPPGGLSLDKRSHNLPRHRLRAQERPSGIHLHHPPPLLRAHLNRMRTSHNARKTAQDVHAPQLPDRQLYSLLHLISIRDIDTHLQDLCARELRSQLTESSRSMCGIEVEEREARKAVFQERAGVGEGKGAGAARYCSTIAFSQLYTYAHNSRDTTTPEKTSSVQTALPSTLNLLAALSAGERLCGTGAGGGVMEEAEPVESLMWGSDRALRRSAGVMAGVGGWRRVQGDRGEKVRAICGRWIPFYMDIFVRGKSCGSSV